ncbi:MAG: Rpn family recombination-promoting nuclease/putative transposase [Clostridiales bacterium]|nr:Rpn family recombination-promoting nuclease/putative transposase [Clostridiales bacterium]
MGRADKSTRDYVNDADVFADAFNYLMYNGDSVVDAKILKPLDTSLLLNIFGLEDEKKQKNEFVQRYRDAVRQATIKVDDHFAYMILGIESQTDIHYGMPIRNIVYDGLQYAIQAEELRVKHKIAGENKTPVNFVSGVQKGDKVLPVVTIVIYFGTKPWDGPLSMMELFDLPNIPDTRALRFIQDYKVFLIEPDKMTDADFDKFSSDLGRVLKFMQRASDKDRMKELMTEDSYRRIGRKAAQVIKDCANVNIKIDSNQEVVDMCKAWSDAQVDAEIKSAIDTARRYKISEDKILADIMKQFGLTEEQAKDYMLKESA